MVIRLHNAYGRSFQRLLGYTKSQQTDKDNAQRLEMGPGGGGGTGGGECRNDKAGKGVREGGYKQRNVWETSSLEEIERGSLVQCVINVYDTFYGRPSIQFPQRVDKVVWDLLSRTSVTLGDRTVLSCPPPPPPPHPHLFPQHSTPPLCPQPPPLCCVSCDISAAAVMTLICSPSSCSSDEALHYITPRGLALSGQKKQGSGSVFLDIGTWLWLAVRVDITHGGFTTPLCLFLFLLWLVMAGSPGRHNTRRFYNASLPVSLCYGWLWLAVRVDITHGGFTTPVCLFLFTIAGWTSEPGYGWQSEST